MAPSSVFDDRNPLSEEQLFDISQIALTFSQLLRAQTGNFMGEYQPFIRGMDIVVRLQWHRSVLWLVVRTSDTDILGHVQSHQLTEFLLQCKDTAAGVKNIINNQQTIIGIGIFNNVVQTMNLDLLALLVCAYA